MEKLDLNTAEKILTDLAEFRESSGNISSLQEEHGEPSPENAIIIDKIMNRHNTGKRNKVEAHTNFEVKALSFIWRPYFARATTNVIFGDAGTGKSLLCAGLTGKWTNEGYRVMYINTEDNPETAFNPRLLANNVKKENLLKICDTVQFDDPQLVRLAVEFKPDIIIYDMIKDMAPDSMDLIMKSGDVRKALTFTNIMAEELNCCCIVTHHSNKAGGNKSVNRIQGTMDWFGKPRSVLEALYDKKNQAFNVFHTKANNTIAGKGFCYKISDATVGYDADLGEDIVAPQIVWQDGLTMTEDDLSPEINVKSKLDAAKDAIIYAIRHSNASYSDGTKYIESQKLRIVVTNTGIGDRTFQEARAELVKRGVIEKKKDGIWVYVLSD